MASLPLGGHREDLAAVDDGGSLVSSPFPAHSHALPLLPPGSQPPASTHPVLQQPERRLSVRLTFVGKERAHSSAGLPSLQP